MRSKETWIAVLATAGIATHWIALSNLPLVFVLVVGGLPLLFDLVRRMLRGDFGSDLLAGISIVTSIVLGQYLAGAIVILMLSGGIALENFATRRASRVLDALAKRTPSTAHRFSEAGMEQIPLGAVHVGDRLVIFPHEICPVDGTVIEGWSTMDESFLTGEPFRIEKAPGSRVLSGAINGESAITITADAVPTDSRYAKIMRVMQEAEEKRPRIRRIADRLGAWYTVFGVGLALLAWWLGHDSTRFLAVLVIATPCPLLLAIPIAIISAISIAAGRAIIIKDPSMLERISRCRTAIFDKTGTLTYGRPNLTDVHCGVSFTRKQVLAIAASLEQYSRHPLAGTIIEAAQNEGAIARPATHISERPGQGLSGVVDGTAAQITDRKHAVNIGALPESAPGMECILIVNGAYAAAFRFRDVPRKESRSFIDHLAPHHQIEKVMLVSGDRDEEVRYLAQMVGIADVLSGVSPEQKVDVVRRETSIAPTLFLGDGINDAPAMQAATVGIAFGQNSDITAEAADAVVLEPSLGKVDELIHIGRRMRMIALQSAIGGMALSVIGMLFAAAGYLPPVAGAIAQEAIDALAVLNAVRMSIPTKDLRDPGL
jgi:heavy metal translocating P-type ATPase